MTKGEQKGQVSARINLLKKAPVISKQPKFINESQEHSGLQAHSQDQPAQAGWV